MAQGPGSTRQNNGPFTVGGFYNFASFTLVDGQACALQFDINGNLKTTTIGGGSGSNAAAGPTGAPVPADADYQGVNVGGTLFGVSGFNLASSVSMAVAIVDASGNQITSFGGGIQYADAAASGAHPTGTQIIGWNKGGSTELAITALPLTNAQALAIAVVDGSGNQITSFGGGVQYVDGTVESVGAFTGTVALGYNGTDVVGLRMDASNNLYVNLHTAIPAGSNLIGQVEVSDGTNVLFSSGHAGYVQFPSAQAVTLVSTTITGTVSVTQGTNPWIVAGNLTHNNAAPAATEIGVLPALANAAAPTFVEGDQVLLSTDLSGNLRVNVTQYASGTTQATPTGIVALGKDGSNVLHALALNAIGSLNVSITDSAVPVTLAPDGIEYPDGTPSGGSPVGFGLSGWDVTNGVMRTLQVDTHQNLKVAAFAQYNTSQIAPGNTGTFDLQIDQSGNLLGMAGVQTKTGTAWDSTTVINTLQYPTGTTFVGAPIGASTVIVEFNSTATTGAVTFQGTYDGINWFSVPVAQIVSPTSFSASASANPLTFTNGISQYMILMRGMRNVRLNLSTTISSGTVTPYWTIANNFVPGFLTDGTNGPVAVKPASTAALVTDPALVVAISPNNTVAVTQSTSPWVVSLTSTTITGNVTVIGAKSNNSVVPGATNLGVLPGIANAATQTWTEGDQVLESMDLSGRQRIRGTLTHNNVAPSSDLIGVMNGLANASAPTYTEGDLVLQSVDLSGNTRIVGTKTNNSAAPTTQVGVIPAVANAAAPTWTEGDQVLLSEDLSGNTRVIQPKDRGRSVLGLTYTNTANATTTTPTVLTTLVENSNYVSSTGVTAFQVPAGKTLRIQSLAAAALLNSTTAVTAIADAQSVYIEIRVSTTNTTTALSTAPIAAMLAFSLDYDVVGSAAYGERSFPDGVEVPAGDYVGITVHNAITTLATIVSGISLIGYTY